MSNIYLNEFDRLMKYQLKSLAYLRYGDDWLCFVDNKDQLIMMRQQATSFLNDNLGLTVNPKIDRSQLARKGVSYLGVEIYPSGRRLQPGVRDRIKTKATSRNIASYQALVAVHEKRKYLKTLNWRNIP